MSELDKAWLESATLKELEDENDELTEDILRITHQIDMGNEFGQRDRGWKQKAKMAKACKVADREIVRRYIRNIREQAKISLATRRDELLVAALRDEIGEERFLEIAEQVKQTPEWHGN